jgi:putative transposase
MRSHLPRLAPEFYQGPAMVHWVLAIEERRTGWLDARFHLRYREVLLHAAVRYGLVCPVYCLMPDHVHLLWMGVGKESDQRDAMKFFRAETKALLAPYAWQRQPFDHVLKDDERKRGAFTAACHYVLENPVRQGLVAHWQDYEFSGAMVPGYPSLDPRKDNFWELFWRIYMQSTAQMDALAPKAG